MRSEMRELCQKVVEKMGRASASYGVPYNQQIRARHLKEVMAKVHSGEYTAESMQAYLDEPE